MSCKGVLQCMQTVIFGLHVCTLHKVRYLFTGNVQGIKSKIWGGVDNLCCLSQIYSNLLNMLTGDYNTYIIVNVFDSVEFIGFYSHSALVPLGSNNRYRRRHSQAQYVRKSLLRLQPRHELLRFRETTWVDIGVAECVGSGPGDGGVIPPGVIASPPPCWG